MNRLFTMQWVLTVAASFAGLALLMAATPAPAVPPAAPTPFPATMTRAGIQRMKLYNTTPNIVAGNDADANPTEPTIDVYLPPAEKNVSTAIVILPGGGYTNLSMANEGSDEAKFFTDHGIAAFVLRYRHAPRYHYPTPILDAQRAIRVVRSNAAAYNINPDRIGIMGFSAGGHLAASCSTMFDAKLLPEAPYTPDAVDALSAKPNFACLLYPVIDMTDDKIAHGGSRTALTAGNKEIYELLSPQLHVTKETPPTFLVAGTNDRTVPVMNSILYYQALLKAGVPAEMHILENGPHGFGMALTGPNSTDPEIRSWPDQAILWMTRHKLLSK